MRLEAFRAVGGFDPALIAGEESDLCLRLRRRGWWIARVDAPMALHDIAMSRFGQWWRRTVRAGHASAEGAARHGRLPERHCVRESRSVVLWGIVVPMLTVLSAWPTRGAGLLVLAAYPVLTYRIYRARRRCGLSPRDARCYALLCVVGKFAQALGHLKYWSTCACGRRCGLIEYKKAVSRGHFEGLSGEATAREV
jgi:hypothetical protein